jgi:hypothetical protein
LGSDEDLFDFDLDLLDENVNNIEDSIKKLSNSNPSKLIDDKIENLTLEVQKLMTEKGFDIPFTRVKMMLDDLIKNDPKLQIP